MDLNDVTAGPGRDARETVRALRYLARVIELPSHDEGIQRRDLAAARDAVIAALLPSPPATDGDETAAERVRLLIDAVDDLWGCIGREQIDHLQPATVETAQRVHEGAWHRMFTRTRPPSTTGAGDGLWRTLHEVLSYVTNDVAVPMDVRLRARAALTAASATGDRCVVCSASAPRHGGLCCEHRYDEQTPCPRCGVNTAGAAEAGFIHVHPE